jgi:hypothetical protein
MMDLEAFRKTAMPRAIVQYRVFRFLEVNINLRGLKDEISDRFIVVKYHKYECGLGGFRKAPFRGETGAGSRGADSASGKPNSRAIRKAEAPLWN